MTILTRFSQTLRGAILALFAISCAFTAASGAELPVPVPTSADNDVSTRSAQKTLLRQPLHFEIGSNGAMTTTSSAGKLRIGAGGQVEFVRRGKSPVAMSLSGADPKSAPKGQKPLAGRTNYLVGNNPARWRTGINQFGQAEIPGVYPGIDLVYYGNGEELEHDYLVAPNADPSQIRMQFQGAKATVDSTAGDLILIPSEAIPANDAAAIITLSSSTQASAAQASPDTMLLRKPVAYQVAPDGKRTSVQVSYLLLSDGTIGFSLGVYDRSRQLVIDPIILYGTYFGGNFFDSIVDMKFGTDGSLYFLMTTDSTDLMTKGNPTDACVDGCGPNNTDAGKDSERDYYVAKLDKTGKTLEFATYIGGGSDDRAYNLALDTDGSIYIAGTSQGSDFPQVNAFPGGQPTDQGASSTSGTLSKLSADGSTLLYSTYIGFGLPGAATIAKAGDSHYMVTANNGIVYVIGLASLSGDPETSFIWKKNAISTTGIDFVAKVDTTKSGSDSIVFATQIGDGNTTASARLNSVAVDSKGDVWLYGQADSTAFPVTGSGALQSKCSTSGGVCNSGFLMELNSAGNSMLYSTFLGGSGGAFNPYDLRIDTADNLYVTGTTSQPDYPTKNGVYPTLPDTTLSGYLSKISPDGKTLLYSTFLQGATLVIPNYVIAASSDGKIAFAACSGPGFPVKNSLQPIPSQPDKSVTVFGLIDTSKTGDDSLLISSYLGGTTNNIVPLRTEYSSAGTFMIAGLTYATDLPVVNAYQATCESCLDYGSDGFMVEIQPDDTLALTPSTLTFPATAVGSTSAAMTATLANNTTKTIYVIPGTLTDSKDFTHSDDCNGILSPQASCTITIKFTPQTAGTLTSTYSTGDLDDATNPQTIALSGNSTGGTITLSSNSLDFGSVADGSTKTLSVTVSNTTSAAIPISGASVAGTGFTLTNNGCGSSVAAGSTCQYGVTVSPTTTGSLTGTLTITDNLGSNVVQLTATGTAAKGSESFSPSVVAFGNVDVGQTATQTVTFTNHGTAAVTITSRSIEPEVFKILANTCTLPVAAGASCVYQLTYTPIGVGSTEGTFSVIDGSSNPSVSLTGTGVEPQNGDVFLVPGSVTFKDIVLGGLQEYPYAYLTFANQTSQTIEAQSKNYGVAGSGSAVFGQSIGEPGYCQYAGNGDYTITLAPSTSCVILVFFDPDHAVVDTTYNAIYQVNWNYVGDTVIHYQATALTANTISPASPVVTPTTIQFPATPNGKKSPAQIVNLTNNGDQGLGFTNPVLKGTNASAFSQKNNCPASLGKGVTCQISVYFTPGATGNEFTAILPLLLSTGEVDVTLNGGTSPSDFVLSTPAATQNNPNATWTISVAPLTASVGFYEPITFTVSSGLDASYGKPKFSPNPVTLGGSSVSTTLTLTPPTSPDFRTKSSGPRTIITALLCSMAFFFSFRRKLKTYRGRLVMMVVLIMLMSFAGAGCSQPTPVMFTVTATSGSISHDITLALQP